MPKPSLPHFLHNLTHEPGIYRMIDSQGTVLYVGKAIDLKKRVSQYFQKKLAHPKTQALVQQIVNVEVTVTRSETEALLLESNLIKTLRPKYNVLLRDDKTYPYLFIQTDHPFPSMSIYRGKQKPKSGKVFGPFPNTAAVHETLHTLQKCFKLRNCYDTTFASRTRPCLQYQIKRCTAPCTNYISKEAYHANVEKTIRFLQGKSDLVIEQLSNQLNEAVKQLEFEKAANLRDQIKQLRLVQQTQPIIHGKQDVDIIAVYTEENQACVELVIIRQGHVIHNQAYFPTLPEQTLIEETKQTQWVNVFEAFIRFYYLEGHHSIPPLIITESTLPSNLINVYETLLSSLRKHPCHLQNKVRGPQKGWLDFAQNNLRHHVEQSFHQTNVYHQKFKALEQYLDLPLKRLACFDVSHTHGEGTLASCVVFTREGPHKPSYRRFNIQGLIPGDDYGALRDALLRYFKRQLQEEKPLPDLLLIDGGKGQAHIAQAVLAELHINTVKLLSITKGEKRKACFDRIFEASTQQFLDLKADSPALHLLQQLRDEAHRFAIQGHRKKRASAQLASSLETIEGIGPRRRKALLQYFGGLSALKKAAYHELLQVPGISPVLAKRITAHFGNN